MFKCLLIGFQYDYYKYCFAKYIIKPEYEFLFNTGKNKITEKIQKIHCCDRINKTINLPFKSIWYNSFSYLDIEKYDDVFFVFSESQCHLLSSQNGLYIKKLRDKYPSCRVILYLSDLISRFNKFDIAFYKNNCDAVLSFDYAEAQKWDIIYCPLPYSQVKVTDDKRIPFFDVYFCGKAKDRLNDIYKAYFYFKTKKMSCIFFITGVPVSKQIESNDIIYNKRISYYKNLQFVKKSNFLLEIVQKNSSGETLRTKEAIVYGKKLLTNNRNIKDCPYYSPQDVYVFKNIEDLDIIPTDNTLMDVKKDKGIFHSFEDILLNIDRK